MRKVTPLKKLLSSDKGNVLVIGAASLPLLLGSAAFALDTIQIALFNRQLQRAADSSAIAGAYAVSQGKDAEGAVHADLDENHFPDLSEAEQVAVGPSHGFPRTVSVRLTAERLLPFMSIFNDTPTVLSADATAALVDEGEFCVISLYDGYETGIDVNGTGDLTLGCGMKTNSKSDDAVTAGGNSSVTALPIAAVGGIDGESNNFVQPTTLQPYSAPQEDPLAWVPDPPPQSCGGGGGDALNLGLGLGPLEVQTLTPGCYESLDIKGVATLLPGTYYINGGDVNIGAQAVVVGAGVTIVMTGPGGEAGDLKINAGAQLELAAPSSGDYSGVLFYRDRRAEHSEVKVSGSADLFLSGALYFPTSDIEFVGHSGMDVRCLQLVGQRLKFRGSANITNECPENSGAAAFRQTVVRLVE